MSKLAALSVLLPAMLLSACSAQEGTVADAAPFNPKQLKQMERELGGKTAGQPLRCLSNFQNANVIRLSDSVLLYRINSNLVYRNDLRGTCSGLARDSDVMVVRQFGNATCSGDLFHLVDRSSGIRGPTCVFGEFTPYRKEKGN